MGVWGGCIDEEPRAAWAAGVSATYRPLAPCPAHQGRAGYWPLTDKRLQITAYLLDRYVEVIAGDELAGISKGFTEDFTHHFGHRLAGARVDTFGVNVKLGILGAVAGHSPHAADQGGDRDHFIPVHAFVRRTNTGHGRTHDQRARTGRRQMSVHNHPVLLAEDFFSAEAHVAVNQSQTWRQSKRALTRH